MTDEPARGTKRRRMSERSKWVLVAFAIVVVLDVLFLSGALRGCGGTEAQRVGDAEPTRAPESASTSRGAELERAPADETARAEPTARREAAGTELLGRAVRGRIELPPGTPAEWSATLVCGSFAPDAEGPTRARAEADGTFVVHAPPSDDESASGWLGLESPWLLLDEEMGLEFAALPAEIVLRPRLGGRVRVRVGLREGRDADRARLAPGDVELARRAENERRLEVKDALTFLPQRDDARDGVTWRLAPGRELAFTSRALDPEFEHELVVRNERFPFASTRVHVVAGVEVDASVELAPGIVVRGRVVDADGAPRSGALVLALVGSENSALHQTRTDAHGAYELGLGLGEPRSFLVRAVEPDRVRAERAIENAAPGSVLDVPDLVLREDRIEGRVTHPDGTPAENARVALVREDRLGPSAAWAVASDGDGRFVLHAPSEGAWRVLARSADERDAFCAEQSGVRPGTRDVELVLSDLAAAVVEARDDAGAPVRGARVTVNGLEGVFGRDFEFLPAAATNELGLARIAGLPEGAWLVAVEAEGHARAVANLAATAAERSAESTRVVLARHAMLSGRIVAADGSAPKSNAFVLQLEPVFNGDGAVASVRDGGRFEFRGVAPGVYVLSVLDGPAASEELALTLAPAERREDVVVELAPTGTIVVLVQDEAGRPASGAKVEVTVGRARYGRTLDVDANGEARFEGVPAGRVLVARDSLWELEPQRHSTGLACARVDLAAGATERVVLGGSLPAPKRVRARLYVGDAPVVGFELEVGDACGWGHAARTGADGTAELDVHGAGPFELRSVDSQDHLLARFGAADLARGAVDVALPKGGVRGRVRSASGVDLPRTLVLRRARSEGPSWARFAGARAGDDYVRVAVDGAFELRFLAPGAYVLVSPDSLSSRLEFEVKDDVLALEFVVP